MAKTGHFFTGTAKGRSLTPANFKSLLQSMEALGDLIKFLLVFIDMSKIMYFFLISSDTLEPLLVKLSKMIQPEADILQEKLLPEKLQFSIGN